MEVWKGVECRGAEEVELHVEGGEWDGVGSKGGKGECGIGFIGYGGERSSVCSAGARC